MGYDLWLQLQGSAENGGAATVIVWNGNGRGDAYVYDEPTDAYLAPQGLFTQLTYTTSGAYALRARHGSVTEFQVAMVSGNTYGRLLSITSRNDNALAFEYFATGTTVLFGYDVGARLTSVDALLPLGSNVVGTKNLRFEHDGLGRRTYLRDGVDGALDGNDWIVTRTYDQLGRTLSETQGGRTVGYHWTEESKRDQIAYPSGITIGTSFDALDRVSVITHAQSTVASYAYAGPGRVLERWNGNGTSMRAHDGVWNDSAYFDAARRPTRLEHVDSMGTLQTGFEHAFDRVGNRLFERRLHDGSKGDNYAYDSLYRLVTFERRVPPVDVGVLGQGQQEALRTWTIDGVQNWRQFVLNGTTASTGVDAVNQYTSFGTDVPNYDANGNELLIDQNAASPVQLRYDFLNRLRTVSSGTPAQTVAHDYDAEGRRVRTSTTNVPGSAAVAEFVYVGWEEIEEYVNPAANDPFALARRYVHGRALDEPVRLENLGFYPGTGTYWYQQTTLGNVAALTNAAGAVVERVTYDAYGAPRFETAGNVAKSTIVSDFGNPYLFQGRRYEHAVCPLYDFRTRALDPARGRFVQRDSIGTWGDAANLGNSVAFVANNGANLLDPLGLFAIDGGAMAVAWGVALAEPTPVGEIVMGTVTVVLFIAVVFAAEDLASQSREHTSSGSESSRNRHERGRARQQADKKRALERARKNKNWKKVKKLERELDSNPSAPQPGAEVPGSYSDVCGEPAAWTGASVDLDRHRARVGQSGEQGGVGAPPTVYH